MSVEDQVRDILFGAEFGDRGLFEAMRKELHERLAWAEREGRPLRVYAGYDPTRPDLHLGHAITLRKLRQFQDLGHHVIFLVGTFTAQVGDTSDKLTGRERKSSDEVRSAAETYAEQCFTILDREKTEVVYNADWLSDMNLADVVNLASNFTVQQFLVRDNYRRRLDAGNPVGLHEFFYALLQGYDAVHLRADVQLGATEQLFNIQAGRKLQEAYGQKPCVCITFPILVGTDGTRRMSKSTGNYVGLKEPPSEQFGKTMSISDDTMLEWIKYVAGWSPDEVERATAELAAGEIHPMELKKRLAHAIVSLYHGEAEADEARRGFESVHQQGQLPDDIPELRLAAPASIVEVLHALDSVSSKGEARRLIKGRGVKIDGTTVLDAEHLVDVDCLLQVGKRRFARVVLSA